MENISVRLARAETAVVISATRAAAAAICQSPRLSIIWRAGGKPPLADSACDLSQGSAAGQQRARLQ